MTDCVTVTVTSTRGSAPREAGTRMEVYPDHIRGTIGGGTLEWTAMSIAREMIASGGGASERTFPLGPDLGQCCGGSVTLTFAPGRMVAQTTAPPLWIWGAGHVGRAVAGVMAPFGDRDILLIDVAEDRLPDCLPAGVAPLVATDPLRVVGRAPAQADHLIVTYSHDLDLALCDALLRHGFGSCGLIGSATKWARFQRRLASMGHSHAQIARIACPIGDPRLGKHPQAIAVSVAAALTSPSAQDAEGDKTG